ncbi:MAG: M56 family metallopeptidase [Chitinophagaceae bacterium]|nr:M56 family metallopeptidase [Chitinophagaceae bacterium]
MIFLAQSAFLKALGWALLHSLWQMGILWFVYHAISNGGIKFSSRQRYNIALILVSLGSLAFIATLGIEFYLLDSPAVMYGTVADPSSSTNIFTSIAAYMEPALPLLSAGYLVIIALLFIRFFRQYYFSHRLMSGGWKKADPELRLFLKQMSQRFNISRTVRIGLSELVNTPLTVGFWKPIILLPLAAINQLSIQQTEAIILHELNHIKQNDYLVNLLIACLDILLFFNPFSRLLTSILTKEREHSCDDMVLQFRYPAVQYAGALLVLEQYRTHGGPILAVRATGNNKKVLLNRVQRILHGKTNRHPHSHRLLAFLLSAFLIAFAGWYNPAKVILTGLEPSTSTSFAKQPSSIESNAVFTTDNNTGGGSVRLRLVPTVREDVIGNETPTTTEPLTTEDYFIATVQPDIEEEELQQASFVTVAGYPVPEREYSMTVDFSGTTTAPIVYEIQPYVPSSSFSYRYTEDTSLPKKYVPSTDEIAAIDDLQRALKALEVINWAELEKSLGKTQVDIAKLQVELKKALIAVDWKKIDAEMKESIRETDQQLRMKTAYLKQLQQYQQQKIALQHAEQSRTQEILMDRLMQNETLKKAEEIKTVEGKQKKVKKIVVI